MLIVVMVLWGIVILNSPVKVVPTSEGMIDLLPMDQISIQVKVMVLV